MTNDQEGCGVWGVGKERSPTPNGYKPLFLNMEKRKRCIARHVCARNTASILKPLLLSMGLPTPHTLSPTPFSSGFINDQ
jgi:hypothetical protein